MVAIEAGSEYFTVRTAQKHEFKCRCVVLAIGLRGHPRRLSVPGEKAGRVHYQLIEPDDFRNQRILVVGGGNAGAEVTQALSAPHLANQVSYSFHDAVLSKVTHENGDKIIALQSSGAITVYPATELKEIKDGAVVLEVVKGHVKNPAGRGRGADRAGERPGLRDAGRGVANPLPGVAGDQDGDQTSLSGLTAAGLIESISVQMGRHFRGSCGNRVRVTGA